MMNNYNSINYNSKINGENVVVAYSRVKQFIKKTPVLTNSCLNSLSKKQLFFKCENFQKVGAFKFRGAVNAVKEVIEQNKEFKTDLSCCTHSSGNHAQAVALACKMNGIKSYIVMPNSSAKCKVNAVKDSYDGIVTFCENSEREKVCNEVKEKNKSIFIHPSNNPSVINGAGTCFYEFWNQMKDDNMELDAIICPIGGGGLASGTAIACKHLSKDCKIFGAEPLLANDAFRSFKSKTHLKNEKSPPTIADGLKTNLGSNTYAIILNYFDNIFTVTEDEIKMAMKLIWERMKIVIEPSSAVPVAVVLYNKKFQEISKDLINIGIILSGGNFDISKYMKL